MIELTREVVPIQHSRTGMWSEEPQVTAFPIPLYFLMLAEFPLGLLSKCFPEFPRFPSLPLLVQWTVKVSLMRWSPGALPL